MRRLLIALPVVVPGVVRPWKAWWARRLRTTRTVDGVLTNAAGMSLYTRPPARDSEEAGHVTKPMADAFSAADLEALVPRPRRYVSALSGSREAADGLAQDARWPASRRDELQAIARAIYQSNP